MVNVVVKRRDSPITSCRDKRDECKRSADEASKGFRRHQNRGFPRVLGAARKVPTYWPCGVRCTGGMTLIRAFVRNLRTGSVMGKGTSGGPTRPKVPMHRPGAHCFVRAMKRGNARGAKGAGHPHRDGVNGKPEELLVLMEGGSLLWVARAG